MFRSSTFALLCSVLLLIVNLSFADEAQAKRIADANNLYCNQEALANPEYCGCISDVYEENLLDIALTKEEENFMIQGLSGQLVFEALGPEDIKLSEAITEKLDNPAFEEGFANCFAFVEDAMIDETPQDETNESLTVEQLRAIEELEAIEDMEDEEED
ncbi:MAG TPA: hypothetical protein H9889_06620 [Candidatus Ignatzschineria merdigallinarum]|uniref:Uncharacterized protein n=1 Tax=Candidatus Ignatzschineria merdigallinarum TaxID=2838621 RepID=A0A9D1Q5Q7_9GAMM|nr:hypothetical protein [Candidatus Ignatzschineria merdigallinarum]